MFTGIVEELGRITAIEPLADGARLTVAGPLVTSDARHGDSIAVNGVCLTVVEAGAGEFTADVVQETLRRSALGRLERGSPVNLERAMALGDRLGGHIVQGHVDGTGVLRSSEPEGITRFELPERLSRYLVEKGSIAVDGVSLTVVEAGAREFAVALIPTTEQLTTLGLREPGDLVNLEVDVLAKHLERLARPQLEHLAGSDLDNADAGARPGSGDNEAGGEQAG